MNGSTKVYDCGYVHAKDCGSAKAAVKDRLPKDPNVEHVISIAPNYEDGHNEVISYRGILVSKSFTKRF